MYCRQSRSRLCSHVDDPDDDVANRSIGSSSLHQAASLEVTSGERVADPVTTLRVSNHAKEAQAVTLMYEGGSSQTKARSYSLLHLPHYSSIQYYFLDIISMLNISL